MRRAIQLARLGEYDTAPNPRVGAVIVAPDGRIIGEGYHRKCGEAHAEVNAVNSVSDKALLKDSTIYVTLEPCSHYGKTPPCAKLLIDNGIKRVVIGMTDPHDVVSGRGVRMLEDSGTEVVTGVLEEECRALNPKFIVSHSCKRPWVTLKWAMSEDGYLDIKRERTDAAARFSTPLTSLLVHRQRALHQAIMVGSGTVAMDNCRLDVRGISGHQPLKVIVDRRGQVSADAEVFKSGNTVLYTSNPRPEIETIGVDVEKIAPDAGIDCVLQCLHKCGVTSVLVEGGAQLLDSFISAGLWDEARIEIAPVSFSGCGAVKAPSIGRGTTRVSEIDGRTIVTITNQNVSAQRCVKVLNDRN